MSHPLPGEDADFLKLWIGQSISQVGSQLSLVALPLTAVLVLHASAIEMGALTATETAAFLPFGLVAGVWADRIRRRPILVAADLGRALALAALPCAYWLGLLTLPLVYVTALAVGIFTVFFDVSYQSYLPSLVQPERLLSANGKLEVSRSTAQIVGPGLAGLLLQTITAPVIILLDAASFVVSALSLLLIHAPEPARRRDRPRRFVRDVGDGFSIILKTPLLLLITVTSTTLNLFTFIQTAVYVLYVTHTLALAPTTLGLIYLIGGIGAVVGAGLNQAATRSLGFGTTTITGAVFQGLGVALVPLASETRAQSLLVLASGQFLFGFGLALYGINQVSLRQMITPEPLRGRMNATLRVIVTGIIPIGALLGGAIGERAGIQSAILVGGLGTLLGSVWLVPSPLRLMRRMPHEDERFLDAGD